MNCPNCHTLVEPGQINIQTDLAKCQNCHHVFKVSEVIASESKMQKEENIMDFDLNDPPKGTWFRYEMNNLIVGASTRSAAAFFLVPFMIIWSGGSLGGIYGTQILNDEFDIVLSLFGLPFLVGSILFWGITLMTIAGKTEVTLNRYDGRVFTGIGKIGITKKFDWEEIEGVSMTTTRGRNGKDVKTICLEAPKDIKFGSALKKDRKYYLYQAVKSVYKKVSFGNSI